ncbi:class I SAM-dependent DNA methyltransferase [Holophaga foetida]|uniref:class I SAM-dependent DNA methyltransferase n=1 Tax=Holophaga foetida TaxID=35839 RepID=UPI00031DDA07|nr:class I SAM-dependent methyltransferase [Holophaga foetida]
MSNRFDNAAASWDAETRRVQMAQGVQTALRESLNLSPDMDLLDFGCGTGLFSLELRPLVRSLTGADTSQPMLEVFSQKAQAKGLEVRTRHLKGTEGLGGPYHLVLSSMALHHVPELAPVFQAIHAALAPGGRIALADLDSEDGSFHGPSDDVFHLGFERRNLMEALAREGFHDLRERTATTMEKNGRTFTLFLITGEKG